MTILKIQKSVFMATLICLAVCAEGAFAAKRKCKLDLVAISEAGMRINETASNGDLLPYGDIALGFVNSIEDTNTLEEFTHVVAGSINRPVLYFTDWKSIEGIGVTGGEVGGMSVNEFVDLFSRVVKKHPRKNVIHFSLSRFSIEKALYSGEYSESATSIEFTAIVMKDELLEHTVFYRGGVALSPAEKTKLLKPFQSRIVELRAEFETGK